MFAFIRSMSLRMRLALLAAFAISALLIASFVAWRLARATETFALRQAEFSLHAAARDIARDIRAHPDGRTTLEPTDAPRFDEGKPHRKPPHPLPPHERAIFEAYNDPLARLTAIALHPFPETAGGLYRTDGALAGFAFPAYAGTGINAEVSADNAATIRSLAGQAVATGAAQTRTVTTPDGVLMFVSYPVQPDDATRADEMEAGNTDSAAQTSVSGNAIAAVWTMRQLSPLTGTADAVNILALVALAGAVLAVVGFAVLTVRDLRQSVSEIEGGMIHLTGDLTYPLPPVRTPELARIAGAINELAANLRANIARQRGLESDLRQSERLAALGRLVAGVAHEIRNPLASMKLKMQIARRGGYAPEKLEATFRVVGEEIERLDALVRRLLEFGRAPALELTTLDLCDLARRRVSLISERAEQQNVRIISELCHKLLVEGDADRLAQVLDNLFQNALEAMPAGGELTLTCEQSLAHGEAVRAYLIIQDTGEGVAPEHCEHIFEPFYSGRDTGTGLGLAIAREITQAHGGKLTIDGQAEGGARFRLELPQAAEAKPDAPLLAKASPNMANDA